MTLIRTKLWCFFILSLTLFVSTSCNKESTDEEMMMEEEMEEEEEEEEMLPETFTQKSLFEKVSREQCGICPLGTEAIVQQTKAGENQDFD